MTAAVCLSKKYVAFMQIDEKVYHDLISKRRTTIHISSVLSVLTLLILNTNKTIDKKSAQNPYIRVFA